MRISDWSSDVCSSDLLPSRGLARDGCRDGALRPNGRAGARCDVARLFCEAGRGSHGRGGACTRASHPICAAAIRTLTVVLPCDPRMTRPRSWDSLALSTSQDRKYLVYGNGVSIRVDLGGRANI